MISNKDLAIDCAHLGRTKELGRFKIPILNSLLVFLPCQDCLRTILS